MNVRIAEPPIGGTIDHILSVLPSLIPSAQRVARICAERPEDVVEMSGADLAAAAETSPPTVSRTCQALGFQGFQHLRMLLVRDLGAAARASRSREAGTAGWLQGIADGAGEILRTSLASVDTAAFESAADAIVAAPRVLLVGTGASGPAAQGIALKLTINGRPCEAPADGVSQQLTARVLRPGDVCVVVSSSGANMVTLAAAAAAREAGATVVGVTSFSLRAGQVRRHPPGRRSTVPELGSGRRGCGARAVPPALGAPARRDGPHGRRRRHRARPLGDPRRARGAGRRVDRRRRRR
ncbi:MurR/RpiR family transcriptional regulator [Microbacterium sp. Se63.02b]|uniref:MurR/RpiR family transcriptional regulator n=1 Tax=Microbacterium sp. Se63.02b TaxID=2709304 RepID=UPI001604CDDC|nr:MurR/RpiR family transcriptional regulator [Microbacterium sp. Se63.02b]QNA91605.1 MurR/RpiR family transcriptional regulator [Microbacterium sp. Se63.02b]